MITSFIIWLLIGAIAGWLASLIVKGHGLGLAGNIVVGIVGAVIAGWLLPAIGFVLVGGILIARSPGLKRCTTSMRQPSSPLSRHCSICRRANARCC